MNRLMRVLMIFCIVMGMSSTVVYGQSCKELFRKAETLRKSEKYDAAIATYKQVQSCGDKSYGKDCAYAIKWINENRPVKKSAKPAAFGVSTKEITLPYQGGEWTIRVYGDQSWTYVVEGDWCDVKKSGRRLIVSSLSENESRSQRKALIKVQSGGKSRDVEVINEAAPERLRSSVSNLSFPAKGESTDVDIYANTDWEITEKPEWVKAEKGDKNLRFTVEANPQSRERQSIVKISSPSDSVIIIHISQIADDAKLAFSKNSLNFGPNGGDEYIKVYTNVPSWRFSSDLPHWVQVNRVADDMIHIHCTPNAPINEIREGSINLVAGAQTLGSINIGQEAKPIVNTLPMPSIGGRKVSIGVSAGYVLPSIATSSNGTFTGSPTNYALGDSRENSSYSSASGFNVNVFADIHLFKNFYLQTGIGLLHYTYKNEMVADGVVRTIPGNNVFYQKGSTQNKYKEDYSFTTLEIPVIASYRFPVAKMAHVQLNLGPVVSYGMSAKEKLEGFTDSETMQEYSKATNQPMNDDKLPLHYSGKGEFDLYSNHVDYTETYNTYVTGDLKRSQDLDDSPFKKLNFGLRVGTAFEYHGVGLGIEYTYMLTNMANKKFWEGDRWKIFDQTTTNVMTDYNERHHYLGIKLSYTFRY